MFHGLLAQASSLGWCFYLISVDSLSYSDPQVVTAVHSDPNCNDNGKGISDYGKEIFFTCTATMKKQRIIIKEIQPGRSPVLHTSMSPCSARACSGIAEQYATEYHVMNVTAAVLI